VTDISDRMEIGLCKVLLKQALKGVAPHIRAKAIEAALAELEEEDRRDRLVESLKDIPTDELERIARLKA
jgi:hypothetical protein